MLEGACRDIPKRDLDKVFCGPVENTAAIEEAKKVCSGCPVKDTCLEYALGKQVSGIWGGTTLEERKSK
jgi:WhiB family redox-sensing transcriptional regulator